MTREELDRRGLDLKAVNPNRKVEEDARTPLEILEQIETHNREMMGALAELRGLLASP